MKTIVSCEPIAVEILHADRHLTCPYLDQCKLQFGHTSGNTLRYWTLNHKRKTLATPIKARKP